MLGAPVHSGGRSVAIGIQTQVLIVQYTYIYLLMRTSALKWLSLLTFKPKIVTVTPCLYMPNCQILLRFLKTRILETVLAFSH